MICPNCRENNSDNSKFCLYCGYSLINLNEDLFDKRVFNFEYFLINKTDKTLISKWIKPIIAIIIAVICLFRIMVIWKGGVNSVVFCEKVDSQLLPINKGDSFKAGNYYY